MDTFNATNALPLQPSFSPTLSPTTFDDLYFNGSNLSEAQQKTLALIPIFTGALSAWGSSMIIYTIMKMPKRSRNCYNRLMLGLSSSDLVSSTCLSLQAFLLPQETSDRVWALGNDTTCTIMGFLQQLSMVSIIYCGMLSWMYLLTIRYGVVEAKLSKRYEPWMHLISVGFPLVGAILGVAMGLFQEVVIGAFCWYAGESNTVLVAYAFGGAPGFLVFVAVIVNNLLVYCFLRGTLKEEPTSTGMDTSTLEGGANPAVCFEDLEPLSASDKTNGGSRQVSTQSSSSKGSSQSAKSQFSNEGVGDVELQALRRQELREMQREQQRLKNQQQRQKSRIRAVAYQAFFYVGAFLITYLPTFILRPLATGLKASEEASVFPLLLIQAIFWPLQGLLNYLIYSRSPASYLRETQ